MLATLSNDLRGWRDRAILLGYAGGLRRSEIVGLDVHRPVLADLRCANDGPWPRATPSVSDGMPARLSGGGDRCHRRFAH